MKKLKKGYGRNYWALAFEGTMFTGGIIVLSTGGAVALFINAMTGSNTLIGLAATLQALLMSFGQLSAAPFVDSIRKLPEFLFKAMFIQRCIPILMALPLFFSAGGYASVITFMILFALFWYADGLINLPWGELCARAVKPELRGHMMGMLTTTGNVLSLLVGVLLAWLLATPLLDDNLRFAFIFTLGGVLLLMTTIGIRMVRDPNPTLNPPKPSIKKFYAQVPLVLRKCKMLQYALIARIPSFVGFASISFVIVFGINVLHLTSLQISWLVYAQIVGGIVSGVTMGEASRRYGNRATILLCNIGVIVALGMALALNFFPNLGYAWLFATCIIASVTANNWFGYFNYFIDIAPAEDRSTYQLLGQVVGIPFSFAGLAMGVVVDRFGFITMFVICGVFAVLATFMSLKLQSKKDLASD